MNLNRVLLCGNLSRTPELRETPGGQKVCNFSVATNRVYTEKDGTKKQDTEFHTCVAWGKQAEVIAQYLTKGAVILVEGRLETRTWDDKEGKKQYRTEVIVEEFQMGPRVNNQRQDEPSTDTMIVPDDM